MTPRSRDSLRQLATTVLSVAVALGAISHVRGAHFGRIGPTHSFYVRSEYGKLAILANVTDAGDTARWLMATWPHGEIALAPGLGGWWRYGGFSYAQGGTAGCNTAHQFVVPYWALAATALTVSVMLGKDSLRRGFGSLAQRGH